MSTFYKIPITRFLLPYLIGIITCNLIEAKSKLVLCLIINIVLLFLTATKKTSWQWALTSSSCFTLGLFSYSSISQECLSTEDIVCKNLHGEIIVYDIKKQNDTQFNFVTVLNEIKYMVYLNKKGVNYLPGDTLKINNFSTKLFSQSSSAQNNYEKHLLSQEVKGQIFLNQALIVDRKKNTSFDTYPYLLRQKIIQEIKAEKVFSPLQEGIFYSLLLGERSYLDKQVKNEFRESGIFHVLAISGLHVGILFVFIQGFMNQLQLRNKHLKLIIVVFVMCTYALIAGLSPSVVRAGLMCTLIQLGFFLQRKNITMNIVLSSALFLLIFNPTWIWNLGFLLSYFAVIFIVLALHKNNNSIEYSNPLKHFIDLCKVNIAAFLGTTPILLYNFGIVYFGSILSSLLIIPLVSLIVTVGLCTVLFVKVKIIFNLLLIGSKYLIVILLKAATFFSENASLPLTMNINLVQCILIYSMLLVVGLKQQKKIDQMKTIALISFCIVLSTFYT